jgi:toxin ParE1/3/4
LKRAVLWAQAALRDLNSSIDYIAERNPAAADRVLADIRRAGHALGRAAIGRPGRVAGTYEKSVTSRPYIIAYALEALPDGAERVVILRVIHTARDWQQGQWPG